MNVFFIDPYEFVVLTNESINHIQVDVSLTEYTQKTLHTFKGATTTTNKKLVQANKDYVVFEDSNERFLFSNATGMNVIPLNYVFDTCVDLTNSLYGSRKIIGEIDNLIRSLSQNFDYTQIGNVLYGFCKLYDSYIIIKIDEQLQFTRLVNHCGPTDVRPFENGRYIEIFDNKPVIRNSERLFIIDIEQKSIHMENQFILTSGLLFVRNLYYSNGRYIPPRRNGLQLLGASKKIVVTSTTNSSDPFVLHSFEDLYSDHNNNDNNNNTTTNKMRHFLFMTTTNEHDLTSILQQLKTRSAQLIIRPTTRKFCVVSTCIRMDSFMNSVKNICLQNGLYMYHDYIFTEFDRFENAQIFAERFTM